MTETDDGKVPRTATLQITTAPEEKTQAVDFFFKRKVQPVMRDDVNKAVEFDGWQYWFTGLVIGNKGIGVLRRERLLRVIEKDAGSSTEAIPNE